MALNIQEIFTSLRFAVFVYCRSLALWTLKLKVWCPVSGYLTGAYGSHNDTGSRFKKRLFGI